MNVNTENIVVVRDKENKIVAVVSKIGTCTEIYECGMVGFEEIAELLKNLTK